MSPKCLFHLLTEENMLIQPNYYWFIALHFAFKILHRSAPVGLLEIIWIWIERVWAKECTLPPFLHPLLSMIWILDSIQESILGCMLREPGGCLVSPSVRLPSATAQWDSCSNRSKNHYKGNILFLAQISTKLNQLSTKLWEYLDTKKNSPKNDENSVFFPETVTNIKWKLEISQK